ncbi:carbamoyltransferase [Niabella ginsenosidivorans]|uniref:Carbamoyltransferase n=1 Tax=Niabella ginsenosidivorans TaxID=1176587 RepID=A0A1A9I5P8_9BACT|nr:carbamoyltransferase C-terminal domain-containing protein [Niabella ginsenosidivorans]ANH81884.1 carbamoyltransferase [Niabella ginsenosidivorans]
MYTLGINAAFHDSAACMVKDGALVAAAEEERFTQIKHGKRPIPFSAYELPYNAIAYCLQAAGIHLNDVDHFSYSFDPALMAGYPAITSSEIRLPLTTRAGYRENSEASPWESLFLSYIINAPAHLIDGYPHHLQKDYHNSTIRPGRWHFIDHHLSHAASAFLPSPFTEAAILTIDGRGETATTTFNAGTDTDIQRIKQVDLPHSLGLLYERVTTHLGFLHSSDEYRVMALASYGKPRFVNDFREMITLHKDGTYTISQEDFDQRFGAARKRGASFTAHHFDIARSAQIVLQEAALELAGWLKKETGMEHLCLAGGVALNCVLNAHIRDSGMFRDIWIQPAAGDAGTALGAALWTDAQLNNGHSSRGFKMEHAFWGPGYTDEEIEEFLKWTKTPYKKMQHVAKETAELLAQDHIIGWFQGRMEFGPRALGGRSILASPIAPHMQARLNELKDREDFRPVAPVVLEEQAAAWFEAAHPSPFMLFTHQVREDKKNKIPAVCHIDGSARIQTVKREQHPRYYETIREFETLTGVPVLVNTSFNSLGKPIVCTPRDALECFWTTPFDDLIIGDCHVSKL